MKFIGFLDHSGAKVRIRIEHFHIEECTVNYRFPETVPFDIQPGLVDLQPGRCSVIEGLAS